MGTVMDLFMPRSYKNGGKYNLQWNLNGVQSAVKLEGTLNNPSDQDSAWMVEIAIPWGAFHGEGHSDPAPEPGTSWRINFSRVQWNLEIHDDTYRKASYLSRGKSLPENNWVWSPTGVIDMHVPEMWGYVEFAGATPPPRWWVWIGQGARTADEWKTILHELNLFGIRGLLLNADTAMLARVVSVAAPLGMEVHAWIWTMNRGDANPAWLDYNMLEQSLAEEKAYVDYDKFMNPALPEVKVFLQKKFRELASVKGLKGIHLDYIRYVDAILPSGLQPTYNLIQDSIMPQFDYGYHPVMVELFKDQHNLYLVENSDLATDSLWLSFRMNELNRTVELLRKEVKAQDLSITAAVFPTPEMSRRMVMRDWDSWKLDAYFPMIYSNFYEKPVAWIREAMEENKRILPATPVICGLYLPALQKHDQFTRAVYAAIAGGADKRNGMFRVLSILAVWILDTGFRMPDIRCSLQLAKCF